MSRKTLFAGGAGLTALGAFYALMPAAVAQAPGIYNMEQATSGHAAYVASCGGCHRANLAGGGDAPALGGNGFMASFGNRSTKDLYNFIAKSMPAGAPGSLGEQQYTNITAYLLYANGAKAGSAMFSKDTDVKVSSIADGKVLSEAIAPPSLGKMAAAEARARAEAAPPAHGLTVKGTVKNYVDVTDDMLLHPADGEWLMYRRNYQGWSYSPLKQITPENVKNLTLKWAWNMNEGGASQVTPIVHAGVMFSVEHVEHGAGAGCAHRRSDLGEPYRSGVQGCLWRHPQPGRLSRQGLCRDHRCHGACFGCAHRQDRLGADLGQSQQLRHRRGDGDARQAVVGHDWLRQLFRE